MNDFIRQAMPFIVGLILALVTWFYSLIEKRINAKGEEIKAMQIDINRLDKKVAVLESEHNQFSQSLKAISDDLKKHMDDKIESLRELMSAKFTQR